MLGRACPDVRGCSTERPASACSEPVATSPLKTSAEKWTYGPRSGEHSGNGDVRASIVVEVLAAWQRRGCKGAGGTKEFQGQRLIGLIPITLVSGILFIQPRCTQVANCLIKCRPKSIDEALRWLAANETASREQIAGEVVSDSLLVSSCELGELVQDSGSVA